MRILLLVLLFVIWEESASTTIVHGPQIGLAVGVSLFFIGYLLLILITRLWGNRLARGLIRGDPGRAVDRFNWGMAVARMCIPAWFAAGVFLLGWKPAVDRMIGPLARWPIVTPETAIALLPGFLGWMGLWWGQFPVDRALREQNVLYQLESDLPVFAAPSFRGYFVNKLRAQVLFTSVPLLTILLLRDLAVLGIAAGSYTAIGQHWGLKLPISDSVEPAVSFLAVLLVLLLAPELLRRVLHTQRLPESQLRESLAELCKDSGVRCREILLWRTQNNMGNAAVMGLFPLVRYVMLSDLLLESMTDQQIRAVFAHELGHVKHRHLIWFTVLFIAVLGCWAAAASALMDYLKLSDKGRDLFDIAAITTFGIVLIVGYGFLSRWFERQADVYAARTLEKPATEQSTEQSPEQSPPCGAQIVAAALERVALVNNIPVNARNWTHGSIQARVRYIHRLARDPQVAQRFDRTGRRVFIALISLTIICGAAAVYAAVYLAR